MTGIIRLRYAYKKEQNFIFIILQNFILFL